MDTPLGLLDELAAEATRLGAEVRPDEAGGRLEVRGAGLRVLVEPGTDEAAARARLDATPDLDAVLLVATDPPYAAVVVDAVVPGSTRQPSLAEALTDLVAPLEADWSDLPSEPLVSTATVFSNPARIDDTARASVQAHRASRVQAPAKKAGWGSLDEGDDAAWAAERVRAALGGAEDPAHLGGALDEQAEAEPA